MTNLLQVLVFVVAWVDWYIYGRKGDAMMRRSPWLIFWACGEVLLGTVSGYVLVDAFISHDPWKIAGVAFASMCGCAMGITTSGIIKGDV